MHRSHGSHQRLPAACLAAAVVLTLLLGVAWRRGQTAAVSAWRQRCTLQAAQPAANRREQQECRVDTSGSIWEQQCTKLTDVCVDQGTFILHSEQYQQVGMRPAGKLPALTDAGQTFRFPWLVGGTERASDVEAELRLKGKGTRAPSSSQRRLQYTWQGPQARRHYSTLPMRPVSTMEPRAYLQHPTFSSCTVPVVWTPFAEENLHHVIRDTGAQLYGAANATPWRAHLKFVVHSPEGLAMHDAMQRAVGSLSNLSVVTLADFSARLPNQAAVVCAPGSTTSRGGRAGHAALQQAARGAPQLPLPPPPPLPASFEGGEQRCFRQMFVCSNGRLGLTPHTYGFGQHLLRTLQRGGLVPHVPPRCGAACTAEEVTGQQRKEQQPQQDSKQHVSSSGGGDSKGDSSSAVLRVTFLKRTSLGRQLLNVQEMLAACRSWKYRRLQQGPIFELDCREEAIVDMPSGATVAQQTDVFIGVHGAGLANSNFMQPGSSTIEILPYEFDKDRWADVLVKQHAEDPSGGLLWWNLVVCDPALSTPGGSEAAGLQDTLWDGSSNWPRNRNVRLTWHALDLLLRQVVDAGGSREHYLQDYLGTGKWRVYMAANATAHGTCPLASQAKQVPPEAGAASTK